jgi:hypothetical protein
MFKGEVWAERREANLAARVRVDLPGLAHGCGDVFSVKELAGGGGWW